MRYFKCVPSDFLLGTAGLPDNEFAAYVRIVLLMYEAQGPIPFDVPKLKMVLKKRPQDTVKLVNRLCDLGKLTLDPSGMLHNQRVDAEMAEWRRNEASSRRHVTSNTPSSEPQEGQKSEQKLHARTRSPARSKESEQEQERERSLSNGANTAREPETLSQAIARRLAEVKREERAKEIGHDETSNQG